MHKRPWCAISLPATCISAEASPKKHKIRKQRRRILLLRARRAAAGAGAGSRTRKCRNKQKTEGVLSLHSRTQRRVSDCTRARVERPRNKMISGPLGGGAAEPPGAAQLTTSGIGGPRAHLSTSSVSRRAANRPGNDKAGAAASPDKSIALDLQALPRLIGQEDARREIGSGPALAQWWGPERLAG